MKTFFASFFGTLFAIAGFIALFFAVVIGVFIAVAKSNRGMTIPASALLVIDVSVPITDAPREFNPSQILSDFSTEEREPYVTLRDTLRALSRARTDNRIKGIFLTGNMLPVSSLSSGYPALREIRDALIQFKESKKPVYAFLQFPLASSYFLESVADYIYVDPQAEFLIRGPATFPLFFANALQKYGIGVQVFRVGKYKSAVEPFTRENMSPENRHQYQQLLGDMWNAIEGSIERSRGMAPGDLAQLINQNGLIDAELAIKNNLGTELIPLPEIIERFKRMYGEDKQANTFQQITISNYLDTVEGTNRDKSATGPKVAIVYAEGDIVDGEGSPGDIGGDKYAREIRKLRLDPLIKAIVLRVNSPGGSAFASEQIYRELKSAQAAKPVVVSMGAYAASGGYYITSASNRIFAEPTTITGSIGVFGMLVNFQKIANDNGITTDSVVTTTPLASLFTPFVQKPESDLMILQKSVDKFYEQFLSRVSSGRQMPVQQVNDLAQGRVWSGVEAEKLKLVDEFGGLMNAVDYASQQAGLGPHPRILEFPERKSLGEKIKEILNAVPRPPVSKADPAALFVRSIEHELKEFKTLNDPENIYARIPVNIGWN